MFAKAFEIMGVWFDIDAAPTALIEVTCDGFLVRIPGSNIDVKAVFNTSKSTLKHYIFEILGIRDPHS